MQPHVIVLTGYGINCEEETAFCLSQAGAKADIVHINDLIDGSKKLADYQILAIPGGFSYGDDTGSGNAMANRIKNNLKEEILQFVQADKLAIAICNGFQVMANLGLVPALDGQYGQRQAALDRNDSNRYEDRWVWLKNASQKCIWTRNIELLHCPIAHGEGKFTMSEDALDALEKAGQVVWRYSHQDGMPAQGEFPINPNGAMHDIAGVSDPTGRIMGMMPHPERFQHLTNEENWTLKKVLAQREGKTLPEEGRGMEVFRNGVNYFRS